MGRSVLGRHGFQIYARVKGLYTSFIVHCNKLIKLYAREYDESNPGIRTIGDSRADNDKPYFPWCQDVCQVQPVEMGASIPSFTLADELVCIRECGMFYGRHDTQVKTCSVIRY